MNIERKFGHKIIAPRRGGKLGGGTKLTESGKKLLSIYSRLEETYGISRGPLGDVTKIIRPDLVIMGSHDLLIEKLVYLVRKKEEREVEVHWIGSYGGLLSLSLGEADISGIHLMDPKTSQYNVPIVKNMFPKGVALFRGFDREVGWVSRGNFSPERLLEGKARLANRNKGSGTRILIDKILAELSEGKEFREMIRGYDVEYFTHTATCKAIAEGKADVTISIRPVAEIFNLKFKRILWESYDLAAREDIISKEAARLFLRMLSSDNLIKIARRGYRIPKNAGERII